jgi:hypothetical protein
VNEQFGLRVANEEWQMDPDPHNVGDLEQSHVRTQIFALIDEMNERDTREGKRRDRLSRKLIHPVIWDINHLTRFCARRRMRQPDTLDVLRRLHGDHADSEALRKLVSIMLERGRCEMTYRRSCERLEQAANILDAGRKVVDAFLKEFRRRAAWEADVPN